MFSTGYYNRYPRVLNSKYIRRLVATAVAVGDGRGLLIA